VRIMAIRPAVQSRNKSEQVNGQDSRERLLRAAIDLFARYGYDPVSTGAVAAAAGLTQSMVHYHFGNKSKLWKAAIERLMHERGIIFPIGRLDLQDLDPLSRLKVIIRKFLATNAADPNLNRILMHEAMIGGPRLRWIARRYMVAGYRVFDDSIKECVDAGLIKALPVAHVTNIIVSACTMTSSLGALLREVYDIDVHDTAFVSAFSDSVVQILFRGMEVAATRIVSSAN
jgi:TetR/AcrR family transcriptional regulator